MATFSPRRTCGIAASCTGVGPCTSISGSRACRAGARALRAANPVSYRPKTYARNSQRRVVAPPATLPTPGRGLHLQPRSCNAAETRQHGLLLLAPKHYLSRVAAGRFAQRTLLHRVDLPQAVASTALPQLAPVPVHRGLGQRPGVPLDAAAAQQGRHRTCTGLGQRKQTLPHGDPMGQGEHRHAVVHAQAHERARGAPGGAAARRPAALATRPRLGCGLAARHTRLRRLNGLLLGCQDSRRRRAGRLAPPRLRLRRAVRLLAGRPGAPRLRAPRTNQSAPRRRSRELLVPAAQQTQAAPGL